MGVYNYICKLLICKDYFININHHVCVCICNNLSIIRLIRNNELFVLHSGVSVRKTGHLGIPYSPRRRISSRRRGHTAFRGTIAADLVQWISVFGDCAQRWKSSSVASGCHAHHQGHRQIWEEKSSGSPSGDLYLQAHFRRTSGAQSIRGNKYLFPGKNLCIFII